MTPKENTLFMLEVYEHFGCSGPITQSQVNQYKSIQLGRLSQQEEETMNVDANNTEFKPVPYKLTDAEVEKLLAIKSLDGTEASNEGTAVYLTDADETADEPTPTIH